MPAFTNPTIANGITYLNGNQTRPQVWRGFNQGMRVDVQGFASGTNVWSRTTRSRHYSNVRFRRVRAVIQCFNITGTPLVDTLFTNSMNFQVAFEASYTNAVTGIPANRPLFHFSGVPIAQYVSGSPPATGYLISDVLDLGSYVEAGQFFGLWTTQEIAARSGSDLLPYTRQASNFIQRYTGYVSAANVSRIDQDTARNATSVTAHTTTQTGEVNYFTPVMLLVETDEGNVFVAAIGDSITYGVGEGAAGSGTLGDSMGSALGNAGMIDRALYETLGVNVFNLGKGSDRNSYLATANNWQYRRALLTLANPTHVINANVHNDITPTITINGWVTATAYNKWDVVQSAGSMWMAMTSGTSGATAPTGTSAAVWDGAVMWTYIQPTPATATPRGSGRVVADMANVNAQIKAAVPDAKIIAMRPTPDASSTDSWATAANQTAATNWGDATSRRGLTYSLISQKWGPLQIVNSFDPTVYLEDGYPTQASKWVVNGSANYVTADGTHPNSQGYVLSMPSLNASLFT